jgi:hypothetical protein
MIDSAIKIDKGKFLVCANNFYYIIDTKSNSRTFKEEVFISEYTIKGNTLYFSNESSLVKSSFNPIKKVKNMTPYLHLLI